MWSRKELKDHAKGIMKLCYWKAVLVALVLGIVTGGFSSSSYSYSANSNKESDSFSSFSGMNASDMTLLMAILVGVLAVGAIVMIVNLSLGVFVFRPVEVGALRFFIMSRKAPASLTELGFSFKGHYLNVVLTQFLRALFTYLWSLLLVVPGIIKGYEYRMIPYILAENPTMNYKDAFARSKDMMMGDKWNAFVLDLSFLGWNILSACTCGILGLFYVAPYQALTNTELYEVLKQKVDGPASGAQTTGYETAQEIPQQDNGNPYSNNF